MTMLTTDFCDLVRDLRSHFFARDRDVILQDNRVFGGNTTGAGTIPIGGIILWSGAVGAIPAGWALCDGGSGTPNLTNSFVVCAGGAYAVGASGGEDASNLAHSHADGTLTAANDTHSHGNGTLATDNDTHNHTIQDPSVNVDDVAAGTDFQAANHHHDHQTYTLNDTHSHDVTGNTSNDTHNHDVTGSTASAGSAAQENRPVYYALAYIMRTA